MKRHLLLLLIAGCLSQGLNAQEKNNHFTVSGYVTDSKSSETLLNASVYDANTLKGSVSNAFGYYSLRFPAGKIKLAASYVGYKPFESEFILTRDTVINIRLSESIDLDEVVVVGKTIENNVRGTQMSTIDIPVMQIKKIPAIFGEADVLKALQLLPGVQSGTEGSAGLYVRGGGPDENLILLDGVPLYNVNHMMGFFSAFNADAVKNVTLYKGNFPARFGGRLSSVVDVSTKDGDMYNYHGNLSIGLIAAKMNVEGPVIKGKTSFNLSFRRTYYDAFTAPIIAAIVQREDEDSRAWAGYFFYDFNLKLNHKFSDRDRLFFSVYSGDDKVYLHYGEKYDHEYYDEYRTRYVSEIGTNINWMWGNRITALRWNHVVTPQLFMNVTATYTQYRHKLGFELTDGSWHYTDNTLDSYDAEKVSLGLNSGIYDYGAKVDFGYKPHENHDIRFGGDLTFHRYTPSTTGVHFSEDYDNMAFSYDTIVGDQNLQAFETNLFIEDNWSINNFVKLNAGLHFSTFTVDNHTYFSPEPRLSLRMLADENLSFKAGYAYMSQYIHLLSSNSVSLPTDLWVPVTNNILPMHAHQVAVGAFYDWKGFEFSVEGYYKFMDNVLEYKDGASFFSLESSDWQKKVVMGEGHAYGIEFLIQRSVGNTTGWIGYTLARTERLFDREGQELNFGEIFPAKYDRRHDLNISLAHKFNDHIDMAVTWIYSSGNCATLGLLTYQGLTGWNSFYNIPVVTYISHRNNYRFNSYQRLDIGINFNKQKKHGTRTWSLSVYNALCHNNPFVVYADSDWDYVNGEYVETKHLKQICLFPIIPTFSWSYKF